AFKSAGSDTLTSIRTVLSATVRRRNGMIEFTVSADGFLYNMVRKMAAFLIEVGLGKMDKSDLDGLLDSSKAFTRVAPPEGLYLYKVEY
ncbi:MAG: tRNA pseudouridine(38-40) synthase TruA, partial [Clostridia bacterium]|nr:tRNA pseudouridine(38-40) synthase TruA [Clostridia bacterium]